MFVLRQLESIDPRVLCGIYGLSNIKDIDVLQIATEIEAKLQLGAAQEDQRLVRSKTKVIKTPLHDVFSYGEKRGRCNYAFALPGEEKGVVEMESQGQNRDVAVQFERYFKRIPVNSIPHWADLIKTIRVMVESEEVTRFMIGKASHPVDQYVHRGMVNRYRKYAPDGYCSMYGLMLLDGRMFAEAQATTLDLEVRMHEAMKQLYPQKFHSDLSSSSAGGLVEKDADNRFYTLYIALCPSSVPIASINLPVAHDENIAPSAASKSNDEDDDGGFL